MVRRVHPVKRTHVHPDLVRVRAAVVVHVYAADIAEVVLGRLRTPLIRRQVLRAPYDPDAILGRGDGGRGPAAAKGTIAPPGTRQTVAQRDLKHNGTAMAGRSHRRTLGMRDMA